MFPASPTTTTAASGDPSASFRTRRITRDRLGRNVCLRFLLGDCRVGSCVYSHDTGRTYLPSGRWWECEAKRAEVRDMSRWPFCRQNPAILFLMFAITDHCIAWKPAQAAKPEDAYVWRGSIMMLEGFRDATDDLGYAASISREMISGGGGRGGDRGGNVAVVSMANLGWTTLQSAWRE